MVIEASMLKLPGLLAVLATAAVYSPLSSSHAAEPNRYLQQVSQLQLTSSPGLESIADSPGINYAQLPESDRELHERFRNFDASYSDLGKIAQQWFGLQVQSYLKEDELKITVFVNSRSPDEKLMHAYTPRNGMFIEIPIEKEMTFRLTKNELEDYEITGEVPLQFAIGYSRSKIVASVDHINPKIEIDDEPNIYYPYGIVALAQGSPEYDSILDRHAQNPERKTELARKVSYANNTFKIPTGACIFSKILDLKTGDIFYRAEWYAIINFDLKNSEIYIAKKPYEVTDMFRDRLEIILEDETDPNNKRIFIDVKRDYGLILFNLLNNNAPNQVNVTVKDPGEIPPNKQKDSTPKFKLLDSDLIV